MRHKLGYRKLNRPTDQRLAMFASQAQALIKHGKIKLTVTRAKELRRLAEKLVSLAKRGTLHTRRQAFAILKNRESVKALFGMVERFEGRPGGFTRIVRIGTRKGDATPMAVIEFV